MCAGAGMYTRAHTHTHPKLELNRPGLNLGVYVVFLRVGEDEPADDRVPSLRAKSDQCHCLLSVTGFQKEQRNNTISFLYLRPDADERRRKSGLATTLFTPGLRRGPYSKAQVMFHQFVHSSLPFPTKQHPRTPGAIRENSDCDILRLVGYQFPLVVNGNKNCPFQTCGLV